MEKPKDSHGSLAVAWDVARKNRATTSTKPGASPLSQVAEELERPGSLVDAIIAKRKAAQPDLIETPPDEDDGYGEPLLGAGDDFLDLNDDDYKEPDISASPKKLPFPTSRADAIRAKLKAKRGF